MLPTILITRPEKDSLRFADLLRVRLGCGAQIVISPVIRIESAGDLPDLKAVNCLILLIMNIHQILERTM